MLLKVHILPILKVHPRLLERALVVFKKSSVNSFAEFIDFLQVLGVNFKIVVLRTEVLIGEKLVLMIILLPGDYQQLLEIIDGGGMSVALVVQITNLLVESHNMRVKHAASVDQITFIFVFLLPRQRLCLPFPRLIFQSFEDLDGEIEILELDEYLTFGPKNGIETQFMDLHLLIVENEGLKLFDYFLICQFRLRHGAPTVWVFD